MSVTPADPGALATAATDAVALLATVVVVAAVVTTLAAAALLVAALVTAVVAADVAPGWLAAVDATVAGALTELPQAASSAMAAPPAPNRPSMDSAPRLVVLLADCDSMIVLSILCLDYRRTPVIYC
ncbi:MAG TPA: hypothetical protein VIU62_01515 [Chloroflexota bacterium]